MKRILSLFAVLVFVVSCGGGSGDSYVPEVDNTPAPLWDPLTPCENIVDENGAIQLNLICNEDGLVRESLDL